jgi:acyl carrier protein
VNPEITAGFLAKLAGVFELDSSAVTPDFVVGERWDSMAVLATIALIDEQFDVTVPIDGLTGCTSVADLLTLVRHSVDQRAHAQ